MTISPRIMERSTNLIDLQIPGVPGISRFRVQGHYMLQGAFLGGDFLFEALAGTTYASPSVIKRGHAHIPDAMHNTGGATRVRFDLNDFSLPINNIPTDDFIVYLRIQAYSQAKGGFLPPGPIVPLPPVVSYGGGKLNLTLAGQAPLNGSAVPGGPVLEGVSEIHSVDTVANVADSLDGTFWVFYTTPSLASYVWYDTSAGAGDPAPAPPVNISYTGIQVSLTANTTAADVASATEAAIDTLSFSGGDPMFEIGGAGNELTITNASSWLVPDVADGAVATGFTFATDIQGVDAPMAIMLPGVADVLDIANQEVPADELLVAFGEGESFGLIENQVRFDHDSARIKYLFLVSSTDQVDFSIYAAIQAD